MSDCVAGCESWHATCSDVLMPSSQQFLVLQCGECNICLSRLSVGDRRFRGYLVAENSTPRDPLLYQGLFVYNATTCSM